ncbi:hypothetical protein A2368_04460 [Candidatus Collierbacteria bacterium RIFOXYB1_FULL_49_13]|uniref:DUF5671 domain-containing protein n=1 Tax=Candidatus Collierbacteria bacterium RIFOXYB1_FULL_49_13 TaxID=1817728 RepID=A0A1F5FJJ4_9BACT|nr:MAG: hypothetical protein A2368_04460 [Candidatus Collierbacteria bacterium RIFOXYB1_FULL_49_13]
MEISLWPVYFLLGAAFALLLLVDYLISALVVMTAHDFFFGISEDSSWAANNGTVKLLFRLFSTLLALAAPAWVQLIINFSSTQ